MKGNISLFRLAQVQARVIWALLLREVVTRYGRDNLGFVWLFLEPMIFTSFVITLWSITGLVHSSNLPIVAFGITGYSSVLLWRNCASHACSSALQNMPLFYHRQVKILDIFIARSLLEITGATCSFAVLGSAAIATNLMNFPADMLEVLFAWTLLCWFGIALGIYLGALCAFNEIAERLWHPISYILFPLSGAVFMVDWLPSYFQDVVLLNPIVHAVEMLREGYFGNVVRTHYDVSYLVGFCLVLTLLGLALARSAERRMEILA